MTLNKEERDSIVMYRFQRAKETLTEAKGNIEMEFWHAAANRLYYACYYAVSALLINNGYTARTHNGAFSLFGRYFVTTGFISKEQNKLYRNLFNLRQGGDYEDWINIEENDVIPLLEPAEQFITEIEKLINKES
ncbi:MAG: HEPN domain-containing protein [Lentimicrobiaceae bacterium]|nr:HEPN domain-containing protein [Lentimicrobiaceae bacterium]